MSQNKSSSFDRFNSWARRSVLLKLFVIGFLILLLLIPSSMLDGLIFERQQLRDQAQVEVASKWGLAQEIGGPVLSVPYRYRVSTVQDGKTVLENRSGYAHFLPDELTVDGQLIPEERYRGIFVVVLYNTDLRINGTFTGFDVAALNLPENALVWEDAIFSVGISDMAGVQAAIEVQTSDTLISLGPGAGTNQVFESGASRKLPLSGAADDFYFSFSLDLNGSSALYFRPHAKRTRVTLEGGWSNPSFDGNFLPQQRSVSDTGFVANWEVLQLNRNYPQQGLGGFIPKNASPRMSNSFSRYDYQESETTGDHFGLRLLLPVDEYKKTYRSTNFSFLFIFITFLTYFFIEVLNRRKVHPVQYLLIGAAILIFYVLLLSISEHLAFNSAYWISCAAVVSMIATYSWFVLRNAKLTALVAGVLLVLYVFFFSLLQLQDYALLFGSIGLFLILAVIMYLTRNIDWYGLGEEED